MADAVMFISVWLSHTRLGGVVYFVTRMSGKLFA